MKRRSTWDLDDDDSELPEQLWPYRDEDLVRDLENPTRDLKPWAAYSIGRFRLTLRKELCSFVNNIQRDVPTHYSVMEEFVHFQAAANLLSNQMASGVYGVLNDQLGQITSLIERMRSLTNEEATRLFRDMRQQLNSTCDQITAIPAELRSTVTGEDG